MPDLPLSQMLAALALAFFGGLHCAGMCGGFVGALQLHRPPGVPAARLAAGYHAGRLTSYAAAGALVGALGGALYATEVLPVQVALLVAGSLMLCAVGIAMLIDAGRASRWLKRSEPAGRALWRLIGPWARRVYPPRSAAQAYGAGLAWGWIPCGMVYAALPLALVAGGPLAGAAVMLAFGLGTLPGLVVVDALAVGAARAQAPAQPSARPSSQASARADVGARARAVALARRGLRPLAAAVLLVFAVSGLAHAARVAGAGHPAIAALASICHGD